MKTKTKKILMITTLGISLFAFTSCGQDEISKSISNTSVSHSNTSTPTSSLNTSTSSNSSNVSKIPTERIDSFLANIKNNFTYEEKRTDIHTKYLFDNNKCYDSLKEQYITLEEETYYLYSKKEDNSWHKNIADEDQKNIFNFSSTIVSVFDSISWTEYDESTKTFYGNKTLENKNVSLKLDVNGKATLSSDNDIITISDIDKTKVILPENVIDDTIVNEKIYTIDESGNYDFNITLLHNILDDWFKENNQWNNDNYKDALAYLMRGVSNNVKYGNIIYLDITKEKFSMAVIHDVDDVTYLRSVSIKNDTWSEYLNSNENSNPKNFTNHLNSLTWRQFSYDQMGIEIDTTMNSKDFNTMTAKIFNQLKDVGYETSIDSGNATKVDLNLDDVVFGFARTKDNSMVGEVMWTLYYLMETNYDYCTWTTIEVSALTHDKSTANNNILDENPKTKWYVFSCEEEKKLDKENANLHIQPQE